MFLWNSKQKKSKSEAKIKAGKEKVSELEQLIIDCKEKLNSVDTDLISKAYQWCIEFHKNKVRFSGDPSYTHPLSVAQIVIKEIPLDDISVASALLHDSISDSEHYNIRSMRTEFGSTIAEIVEGIHKIKHIESQHIDELENYRKFLLAMFKDVRIIFVKLADRLHYMRTLEYMPIEHQQKVSKETMEIYAPFANRFGMSNLRWELEDLAFKFINRKEYNDIKHELNQSRKEREDYIEKFAKPLIEQLSNDEFITKNNIEYEISGRPKHIYSIYNKIIQRDKPMHELFDLFAVRFIIESEDSGYCNYVYNVLINIYKPVDGTYKDYITFPKKNGYQSIHIAVIGPGGHTVEVQIRTRLMHEISERGVAAHFKYKRGLLPAQTVLEDESLEQWMDLVRSIFEHIGNEPVSELIENVKKNLFKDEIFVFTPSNEFKTLPKDSTPLDFAYSIHTDIGNHFIGAKVGGKVVPIDFKLQSGDQIEILTSKNQKPLKDWLKVVITQKAKSSLNRYFNDENRYLQIKGRTIWENMCKANDIHVSNNELDNLCRSLEIKGKDAFFAYLASEDIDINFIFKHFGKKVDVNESVSTLPIANYSVDEANHLPLINSQKNNISSYSVQSYHFSDCCYPLPGDKISGIIRSAKDIEVHRSNCSTIHDEALNNAGAVIEIDWRSLPLRSYPSRLDITAQESATLISDITTLILSLEDISIKSINFDTSSSKFSGYVIIELTNNEQLNMIIFRLKAIEEIKYVERYMK